MSNEKTLRDSLGIPAEAERVIIFGESSHWDPNWLYTSQEYYDRFVQKQLDQAIAGLLREPRRIYSIECMFFLRMYWERNPDQHATIRDLVNKHRLRLTNSGVTTADTLVPSVEALLRDFLLGQEWLRGNGMTQEPKLAYFADSFGSSPALPSLAKAGGFQHLTITRIDGMYFPGFERNNRRKYPRPNSTAERLLKKEGTLDFIWRDHTGTQTLCHWNAFSYGQGDLLAHRGFSRIYVFPVAVPDRSERNVERRIRHYVKQLEPYSQTPYLFCPIGFDFVPPIPDLVALLDRYNERQYPSTKIWALNAGLDDYLDLVDHYQDRLPVIELDPNPYWTGFYTSRPSLKRRCQRLVNELLLAEELSHLPENVEGAGGLPGELAEAWWIAATTNHHDFITGTSPDRTVDKEQVPWLEEALLVSSERIKQLTPRCLSQSGAPAKEGLPLWSRDQGKVYVETPFYGIALSEDAGGSIIRAEDPRSGTLLLDSGSNDLISYKDSGGLWRMGNEFDGGIWSKRDQASRRHAELSLQERHGGLEISWMSRLDGEEVQRAMWFHRNSPLIYFYLQGRAPKRRSVVATFSMGLAAERFLMDTPGGIISRSCEKIFSPTFWPFHSFLHIRDRSDGRGVALYRNLPGAASFSSTGELQVVALRNAPRERAYHVLPVPGNPAKGYEKELSTLVYALEFTPGGDWIENKLAQKAHSGSLNPWADPDFMRLRQLAKEQVQINRTDMWVIANKPAARGKGRIVRLYTLAAPHQTATLRLPQQEIAEAYLCDARERDIHPLEVRDGMVTVTLPGTIATVRLIMHKSASPVSS